MCASMLPYDRRGYLAVEQAINDLIDTDEFEEASALARVARDHEENECQRRRYHGLVLFAESRLVGLRKAR